MRNVKNLFGVMVVLSAAACEDPVVYTAPATVPVDGVVVQQPAPVIVQERRDDGSFLNGYLLSHVLNGGGSTREVHHYHAPSTTTVVHTPAPGPTRTYVAPPSPVRSAPSVTMGYRSTGTTRSVTVSAPSPSRSVTTTGFRSTGSTRSVSVSRGR